MPVSPNLRIDTFLRSSSDSYDSNHSDRSNRSTSSVKSTSQKNERESFDFTRRRRTFSQCTYDEELRSPEILLATCVRRENPALEYTVDSVQLHPNGKL